MRCPIFHKHYILLKYKMTVSVPNVKYNLLLDTNAPKNGKLRKSLLSITVLIILLIPIIFLFVSSFLNISAKDIDKFEETLSRAELYSLDEYLHRNTPCQLCNSSLDLSGKLNGNGPLKLVCYYNIPKNNTDALKPEKIDCNLCTHINIAFATIINGTIALDNDMIDAIPKVVNLKKCNKQLKVLLSIGGQNGDSGYPDMVFTHASRKVFIKSIKTVLRQYELDGVDLDWEFPAMEEMLSNVSRGKYYKDKRQRQHFSQLLREIRTEYIREKRDYLLTIAVAAPETIVQTAYDVGEINQYADFINLMSYDFHFYTKYTPFTGFNSPLYQMKEEILYLSTLNINYTANMWLQKGMDRNKIVIGLPIYGHSFTLVNSFNALPGSPASGYGKLGSLGFVSYWEICDFMKQNVVNIFYNNQTFSPYLHKDFEWISFEDKRSIAAKGQFIKDNKFGGAMIYSLNNDDFSGHCLTNSPNPTKFFLTHLLSDIILDNDL